MTAQRNEKDSMGWVAVPAERLWGAQTQRALHHFAISSETLPMALIRALAEVKRAAAQTNQQLGRLSAAKAKAIVQAAEEVLAGQHDQEFPLAVWQTGSGTQTNMNMNEVLANRASELLGGERGAGRCVHPNDDVNCSQSSNDVFPSAMHIAAAQGVAKAVLPALKALCQILREKSTAFQDIVKIGRTHLQDATPLTLGQEISGWLAMLEHNQHQLEQALPALYELALGGTAVGTGLNAPAGYAQAIADALAANTNLPFVSAANKFAALAGCDALLHAHGALKGLAASLMKIANDIRWLASGPRCGLGELRLPENEPGSSIMPGKVNPTQCEAITMIACQVMGNDVAITLGSASGNFELNVYRPMIIYNFLQSIRLLAEGMESFRRYCVAGMQPDEARIAWLVGHSLMLVTALNPHIGYDKAAEIARKAHQEGMSLKEAALSLGYLTAEQFDAWVRPEAMAGR